MPESKEALNRGHIKGHKEGLPLAKFGDNLSIPMNSDVVGYNT